MPNPLFLLSVMQTLPHFLDLLKSDSTVGDWDTTAFCTKFVSRWVKLVKLASTNELQSCRCDPRWVKSIKGTAIYLVPYESKIFRFNVVLKHWGWHKVDGISKLIFKKCCILIQIPLQFLPKGPIDNNPPSVQIMDWRRLSANQLSEPMMAWFYWGIILPQWVKMQNIVDNIPAL